ncbi:MAG: DUF4007 family protein [Chloroflexaceae bacterium]|nr:DUF4007 family protein [Chloroflexaceae bacterium]
MDEDSLLQRLYRIEAVTEGAAVYADQAGIRQVLWHETGPEVAKVLLQRAWAEEGTR